MQVKNETFFRGVNGRIKRLAADQNLSTTELAMRCDMSYRTAYMIVKGTARLQGRLVNRVAKGLGTTTDWILNGDGPAPKVAGTEPTISGILRDTPGAYSAEPRPASVRGAIRVISEQMGLDEKGIADALARMMSESIAKKECGK